MVAGTFNAYTVDSRWCDPLVRQLQQTNGAAGTISLLFIAFAMVFGLIQKHFQLTGWKETVVGLVCTVAALAIGMALPIIASKGYLVIYYICLHLPCSSTANVAFNGSHVIA